jgi:hypothetical protein
MSGQEETHDLQAWFRAESGETVGASGNEERVRSGHISIFAEIRFKRNPFLSETLPPSRTSYDLGPMLICGPPRFWLLTTFPVHGILSIPGIL